MFETILRSDDSENKYFGQLRMDNDDVGANVNAASPIKSSRKRTGPRPGPKETDMHTPLYSWKDRIDDENAVVIGTLMRINDHVRLDDGRLMLLLHAIERFVVMEPKRKLPYPVADVILLPDEEELGPATTINSPTTNGKNVGLAISNSLRCWQKYEYDESIKFPIERDTNETDYRI
eukprot:4190010-Ditylum_brightwellii.AAC.1